MNLLSLYLIVVGTILLLAAGVLAWLPEYRHLLVREDSLVENLSALAFLAAFVVGAVLLFRNGRRVPLLVAVTVLGLLGFLDELSFGERRFAFTMPSVGGVKLDAVHDLVELGYRAILNLAQAFPVPVVVLAAAFTLALGALAARYRHVLVAALVGSRDRQAWMFAGMFAALLAAAIIIDLEIVDLGALYYVEELCELTAAIALLFCALCFRTR